MARVYPGWRGFIRGGEGIAGVARGGGEGISGVAKGGGEGIVSGLRFCEAGFNGICMTSLISSTNLFLKNVTNLF